MSFNLEASEYSGGGIISFFFLVIGIPKAIVSPDSFL